MRTVTHLIAVTFLLTLVGVDVQPVRAGTKLYEETSPYDTSNTKTDPRYDVQYVSVAEWDDAPNAYYFYLNFAQPIFQSQFSDGRGSWAGVLIDTNFDGTDDVSFETDGYMLPTSNTTVPGSGPNGCSVRVFSNISQGAKWLGFRVDKSCVGFRTTFGVQGYADYNENDETGFDYAPSNFWRFTKPGSVTQTTTTLFLGWCHRPRWQLCTCELVG